MSMPNRVFFYLLNPQSFMKNLKFSRLMNACYLWLIASFMFITQAQAQSIAGFTLVNAQTNTDLFALSDGQVINLASLSTTQLNIRANTSPATVGSVRFYENGTLSRTENVAPYALKGDQAGNYYGYTPPVGTLVLQAIPYAGNNGSGNVGAALTINITFIDQVIVNPPAAPTNLDADVTAPGVVNLRWNDNATNETSFVVEFTDETFSTNPTWTVLGTTVADDTTFTDNTLGTTEYRKYRVSATNTAGSSAFSNIVEASNLPLPPTNLVASNITTSSFLLSWTEAPYGNDYLIEYSLDGPNGPFQFFDALYYGYTQFEYTGLQAGTTYYLRMRTNFDGVASVWSPVFEVTTLPDGQAVTSLVLVDADANQDIRPLVNNDTLNLFYLPNLSIRALTSPGTVGSVGFNYDGNANFQTENIAPYALAGDTNGDYNPWTPTLGSHVLIATPYTASNKGGVAGQAKTINFTVINEDTVQVQPPIDTVVTITGELKKWHKVTLSFNGPQTSEAATPNPFADYRLNVTFTNGTRSYTVPGFYAADGNAANTSATTGKVWQVHFAPDEVGTWTYTASFRTGNDIAISNAPNAGTSAGYFDGVTRTFTIAASDKSGRDFRGKGRLEYVGEHYLRFRDNGEYFIKAGADAPENTFAYEDFDATPNQKGHRKSWSFHAGDFDLGDAQDYTWGTLQADGARNQGRELLGAVKYLADQGMNVFSFLTFSLDGDDDNVYPHLGITANAGSWNNVHHDRFDVSKLAQWEQVMAYGDKKGMYLHFKTQETENDQKMDGGLLGRERKLYYRELIARFGHHLALNWNLGEENDIWQELSDPQNTHVKAYAQYIHEVDPYNHNIVIHSYPNQQNQVYNPLLGSASTLTGASVQTGINNVHRDVKKWVNESATNGKKWIVCNDEQGGANIGVSVDAAYPDSQLPEPRNESDNRVNVRKKVLWGTLMAGGAGVEYYYGYQTGCDDLACQDHRTRATKWQDAKVALDFFNTYLQAHLTQMSSNDGLTADNGDYVFAQPGNVYVIYRPSGGATTLNLSGVTGTYQVQWYNPRSGGALQNGTIATLAGGNSTANIGNPPSQTTQDWVALITLDASARHTTQVFSLGGEPQVYPNPLHDYVNIVSPTVRDAGTGLAATQKLQIELRSLQGQLLKTLTMAPAQATPVRLNTQDLAKGVYLLKIVQGNKVSIHKLIKE